MKVKWTRSSNGERTATLIQRPHNRLTFARLMAHQYEPPCASLRHRHLCFLHTCSPHVPMRREFCKPPTKPRKSFTSPRILAQIAKKIMEENLNVAVQVVDPVDPPEGDDWTTEAIKMVGSGAVHAGMEFWSEDLRNCQNLELCTESEPAVESMELGVVGLNGFYIPSYLLESHPELASWEAYKTNETAALFATNSTYPLGRFEGVDHGYGGAQFAEEIISNLDLPFVVEYTDGGEEAALQLLADTVANRGPMIMYMWEPASVIMEYNLSSVDLPNMTEACQVSADTMDGQYNCTYMEEPLYKFVNPGLEDAYPTVYAFIQEFTISNDIDEELIYRVDTEGEDIGVVASDWVDSNRDIWEPWVEAAIEQDGDDTQGDVKHVQDNGNANSGAGVSGQYIACAISGMLFALGESVHFNCLLRQ